MFQQISINEAINVANKINGIIVDLRSRDDYEISHLQGAISIPFEEMDEKAFFYYKNKTIILYCEYGTRSMRMAWFLEQKGYQVINTIGGFHQYNKERSDSR